MASLPKYFRSIFGLDSGRAQKTRLLNGELRHCALGCPDDFQKFDRSLMTVQNGLYSITIKMQEGKRGRATGVIILRDGRIFGGDNYFYYTGSYTSKNGKWRGELVTHQHTEAIGANMAFGGRDVPCGFTGIYFQGTSDVEGTALVGKISVFFRADLRLLSPI